MTATGQSLYDKLGADVGITKAVDEFYNRVVTDPDLAQFFSGVDMAALRRHQVAMLSAATGGPALYTAETWRRRTPASGLPTRTSTASCNTWPALSPTSGSTTRPSARSLPPSPPFGQP
jgi:truncated hemoglobin YjbI